MDGEYYMKEQNVASTNRINLDYDFNTEYGDGDIPDIDKNSSKSHMKSTVIDPKDQKNQGNHKNKKNN